MDTNNKVQLVLAESFWHYPLMKFAFEGRTEQQRLYYLQQLYKHCTTAAQQFGGTYSTPDGNGAIIWLNGDSFPLTLLKEIKSGMAAIPFKLGAKSTLRLMNHDAVPEGWIGKHAGPNMGYLWCIGVLKESRGKGISRILVEHSIAEMKKKGMTEFWLKTDDYNNVPIYQKLGFEIMFETKVKSSGLPTWAFRRIG